MNSLSINIDSVGPYTGITMVAVSAASPALDTFLDRTMNQFPANDHSIYYSYGPPSIAVTSKGIKNSFHILSGTYDWIISERQVVTYQLALALVEELAKQDLSWSRPQ